MRTIRFEKWEDMKAMLNDLNKEKIVCLDVIRVKPAENIVSAEIWFQVNIEGELYTYHHVDDMPSLVLVPSWFFQAIGTNDPELRKDAVDDYNLGLKEFEDKIKLEYTKAEDLLKGMGFKVIMALIQ
jgi:hypothetical protein